MSKKYRNRANVEKLTKLWDLGELKDCYCLIFSNLWGFKIIWNNEDGEPQLLKNDGSKILQGYFVVLAIYETEEQAKQHFQDFVKWSE